MAQAGVEWVAAKMREIGTSVTLGKTTVPHTMRLTLTPKTLPPTSSYNVIADWKGSEHPEEVVLVSGHLDSWDLGTGAIDDGAGVAISMQTIHLLQSLNVHPNAWYVGYPYLGITSGLPAKQAEHS
jgi:hypothetical protein